MKKLAMVMSLVATLFLFTVVVDNVQATEQVLVGFIQLGEYYGGDENVDWLVPLLAYENGKYRSFKRELEWVYDEKIQDYKFVRPQEANKLQELLKKYKFSLYRKGALIGEFQVTGRLELGGPEIALRGRISWKVPKPKIGKKDAFSSVIGLSRPIAQPLWPKQLSLTAEQSQSLQKVINSAFSTAFQRFKVDSKRFAKPPEHPDIIEVMDLEKDGLPEVYVGAVREDTKEKDIEVCVGTDLLLAWRNNQWVGLLKGYNYAYGDDIRTEGEGSFTLWPIDIDGDGTAELIMNKGVGYEGWEYYLYRMEQGRFVKVLSLGGGGL